MNKNESQFSFIQNKNSLDFIEINISHRHKRIHTTQTKRESKEEQKRVENNCIVT